MSDRFTVESADELGPFLFARLPEMKHTNIRNLVRFRAVTVNGRVITRCNHALNAGDKVKITFGKHRSTVPRLPAGLEIAHEDSAVLLVNKPAGLLTVSTDSEQDETLHRYLDDYIRVTEPKGEGRVYLVHRLDRETSGLIVFAKNAIARRELKENWKQTEKKYLAVVDGVVVQTTGTIRSYLEEDRALKVFSGPRTDTSKLAVTHFKVLQTTRRYTLLELTLETGRKNQIRVHCADIGHPVVGDAKYGGPSSPAKRLALHSHVFEFVHPVTRRRMRFESPLPEALKKLISR
ncbi:MAG: RluA family pseudouridine synthase [Candidatus Hydrogenedentes bacterium]|nr:RluA family pseudouridine synthase [Candidatus Hydrogenedentota bacterium]